MSISKDILELSEKILSSGKIKLDSEGVTEVDGSLYEENLPEGLTMDTVKQVQTYDSLFNASVLRAFGKVSKEAFRTNEELQRTAMSITRGIETSGLNYTKVQGKMANGDPKNPSVSVISRRYEHASFGAVREEIYSDYHELYSKTAAEIND